MQSLYELFYRLLMMLEKKFLLICFSCIHNCCFCFKLIKNNFITEVPVPSELNDTEIKNVPLTKLNFKNLITAKPKDTIENYHSQNDTDDLLMVIPELPPEINSALTVALNETDNTLGLHCLNNTTSQEENCKENSVKSYGALKKLFLQRSGRGSLNKFSVIHNHTSVIGTKIKNGKFRVT